MSDVKRKTSRPRNMSTTGRTVTSTMPPVRVTLNGDRIATVATTLAELLEERGYAGQKVATAVNGTFVPERQRETRQLADSDAIEVVSARQGG
jgi:sulfur carrier protein